MTYESDKELMELIDELWRARGHKKHGQIKNWRKHDVRILEAVDAICDFYERELFDLPS